MSKNKLHELTKESLRKLDSEIIENIVKLVYNQVISASQHHKTTQLTWDVNTDYIFGNCELVRFIHIVKACARLQELFPDSIVTHTTQQQIIIDWT